MVLVCETYTGSFMPVEVEVCFSRFVCNLHVISIKGTLVKASLALTTNGNGNFKRGKDFHWPPV